MEARYCFAVKIQEQDLLSAQLEQDFSRLLAGEERQYNNLYHKVPKKVPSYVVMKWMELFSAHIAQQALKNTQTTMGLDFNFVPKNSIGLGEELEIAVSIVNQNRKFFDFSIHAKSGNKIIASAEHRRIIYSFDNSI